MMEFSAKQRRVLQWWRAGGVDAARDAIICDGAVRSGKTLCTGVSFFLWAMCCFDGRKFALCGKTITSVRRNVLTEVLPVLRSLGLRCEEKVSQNLLVVKMGRRQNAFYLFGGGDEGSAGLIQGVTLAGALMDEVALMPRSFVEQCCARCSVGGSRLWFSCNPETPTHWFYKEWILEAERKNALYLTFRMEDNPVLDQKVRQRYESMFQGAFYRRFILGEWVTAEGRVYDFFDETLLQDAPEGEMEEWYISCDYGTVNPTSMALWGRRDGVWYRMDEFFYDARARRKQRTDSEYAEDLKRLAGDRQIRGVIVDPSAASFIEVLRRQGWRVQKADNEVLSGIRRTAEYLKSGRMVICRGCQAAIEEFSLYKWDERGDGDRVCKEHDHAMDEVRYFASTVMGRNDGGAGFYSGSVERRTW